METSYPFRHGVNPAGADFGPHVDDGSRFKCVHQVDFHPAGTILSKPELGPGVDIDRLLHLGAIQEVHGGKRTVEFAAASGKEPALVPPDEPPAPPRKAPKDTGPFKVEQVDPAKKP